MYSRKIKTAACLAVAMLFAASAAFAQMGRTWPSEKKIVPDPVTGSSAHISDQHGWRLQPIQDLPDASAVDRRWQVAHLPRSARDGSQAFAVNEETGQIVQVTETGFSGMLCAGNKTMKLYVMAGGGGGGRGRGGTGGPRQILEIDLARLFADVAAGP